MMNADMFAIDANVIVRHLLADHPDLSPKARAIFQAVENGNLTVFCEGVTLAEAVWVMESLYKLSPVQIATELVHLVALQGFRMPNKELYVQALRLYGGSVPHFGDACACAAALEQCDGRLLSFDKKLSRVKGVHRCEEV